MSKEPQVHDAYVDEEIDFFAQLFSKFATELDADISEEAAFHAIRSYLEDNVISVESISGLADHVKLACIPPANEQIN